MKKKILAFLGVAGMGAVALAEETSGTTISVPTAVDHSALASAVTSWAGSLVPTLITIAACFIGFYLLKFGIRAMKSIAGASK